MLKSIKSGGEEGWKMTNYNLNTKKFQENAVFMYHVFLGFCLELCCYMFNSLTAEERLQEVLQHYISITNLNFKEKYLEKEKNRRKA